MPRVECFKTEERAKQKECEDGKEPFIFAVQGPSRVPYAPVEDQGGPDDPVSNDSIDTSQNADPFNYASSIDGDYYWMDGVGDKAKKGDKPPEEDYDNTMYCVDCKCPGAN